MRSIRFRFLCAAISMLVAMMACNVPTNAPGITSTNTVTAPAPGQTETPTDTATPGDTATVTLAPEPSLTPTLEAPIAKVIKEINCRVGPGGAYDLVLTLGVGDTVEVMARDLGGGFVFVRNPNEPDSGCWVLQDGLAISGDLTPLPAFTPPASPTLAPNFTVTYKNVDSCKGNFFVRFIVVNTGSSQFRSAYVKVTNLKNNEVTEQVVNAFDLTVGCIVAQNIAPLKLGQTGYLQSDLFQKGTPKGQKMRATFQLCVEQNLKGACVTQTLSFVAK